MTSSLFHLTVCLSVLTSPTSTLLTFSWWIWSDCCADRVSSMCSKQRLWRLLCASVVVVSWAASVELSLVYIQPLANCFGQDKGGMTKAWFIYQLFTSHSRIKRLCCCFNHFSLLKIEALWICIFYDLRAADSTYFLHCYCPLFAISSSFISLLSIELFQKSRSNCDTWPSGVTKTTNGCNKQQRCSKWWPAQMM